MNSFLGALLGGKFFVHRPYSPSKGPTQPIILFIGGSCSLLAPQSLRGRVVLRECLRLDNLGGTSAMSAHMLITP